MKKYNLQYRIEVRKNLKPHSKWAMSYLSELINDAIKDNLIISGVCNIVIPAFSEAHAKRKLKRRIKKALDIAIISSKTI